MYVGVIVCVVVCENVSHIVFPMVVLTCRVSKEGSCYVPPHTALPHTLKEDTGCVVCSVCWCVLVCVCVCVFVQGGVGVKLIKCYLPRLPGAPASLPLLLTRGTREPGNTHMQHTHTHKRCQYNSSVSQTIHICIPDILSLTTTMRHS